MKEQMSMFEDGGLMDEGGSIDPVSGNDVPPGSTQEEVRDDIPAQLSEGEFVFPADVVRFIGLGNLMRIRQDAKMGLKQMEAMGQMGNSDEATMPDDLPFDINDLDMEDDGVVEFADGGLAGPNSNTGVYFNPALPQQDTGYIKAAPIQAASSTYQAPQQYVTPTMAQTTTPSFGEFVQPEEGMKPELRTYINSATGEKIQITFINGQPTTPIPDGYVPASEYVKPESVKTEKVTTGSTSVGSVSDSGNDDARQAEEAMYGPGGGRVGVAGEIYGVSFENMGGIPGFVPGSGAIKAAGLALGKPLPAEAKVNFQQGDNRFTMTGTEYNNFKAIAKEFGYNSPEAVKALDASTRAREAVQQRFAESQADKMSKEAEQTAYSKALDQAAKAKTKTQKAAAEKAKNVALKAAKDKAVRDARAADARARAAGYTNDGGNDPGGFTVSDGKGNSYQTDSSGTADAYSKEDNPVTGMEDEYD